MKRIFLLPACLVGIVIAAQAQKNPPPPPPPEPPVVEVVKFTAPVIRHDDEFLKRNPTVKSYNFRSSKESTIIILTMKDKTVEKYDLGDEKQTKAFSDKFGELPPPPPPLPPPPAPRPPKVIKKVV